MGNQALGGHNLFISGLEQCSWFPSISVSPNSTNRLDFLPFIREQDDVSSNEAASILTGVDMILLHNESVSL